jgi:hypothetical protein
MRKELRPVHDQVTCDVCGRTILKGERTEAYLAPGGQRKHVCDLCADRASQEGWIRESAHGDLPATSRRPEPRRSLLGRMRRRREEAEAIPGAPPEMPPVGFDNGPPDAEPLPDELYDELPAPPPTDQPAPPPPVPRSRPKDPRHVRAVPTNDEVKVERALDLFNGSEHRRTIAGIARTLGEPWVSAAPDAAIPSEVSIVIAWELSWYHYRVDLGAEQDPVNLLAKGQELEELDDPLRDWNATASLDGQLEGGVRS